MDWLIIKSLITLLLIIGLMFGLLIVAKRFFLAKPKQGNSEVRVLNMIALQPKKAIYFVKVLNRIILVGVSDNAIASLGEVGDPDSVQKLEILSEKGGSSGFSEVLRGLGIR
ncbi:MAG: flagellar biosynthetic protein FliO [Candidatus Kryptoniota bacterium]